MDQPDIAPLARRLAEENNVDWRRLRGSGDDGRVVERDVLEYLARVMAGDEAVDPTPEPVPEGMQAWPEADVRAGAAEADAAREEIELTSTIEDDIFLFDETARDDEGDDVEDDAVGDATPAATIGDDPVDAGPTAPPPDADHGGSVFDRVDAHLGHDVAGDDDLEEDLLVAGDGDPTPASDALSDDEFDAAVAVPTDPDLPDLFGADAAASSDARDTPDLFVEDEPDTDGRRADWFGGPELSGDDGDEAASGGRSSDLALDAVPSLDEPLVDEPSHDGPASTDEDGTAVVAATTPGTIVPPLAVSQEPAPTASLADVPLLRHGHVWRRQVDLSALVAAQADLAGDLGRSEPVPLAAFLVRASQKALADRGGAVALARLQPDAVHCVPVDAANDFASTVRTVERALTADAGGDAAGVEADLVVADLSEYGVDDAVVRVGAPVLSLGRVLIDNQSGGRRAYLAMSGDGADGSEAAQVLARVAEMLEAPVRVVV